ncbi:NERD domain-containing protein [Myroides pelagicus]|uniref:DUF2075 domain-containing protein n=1 Tax=Myroides pelagicus TaxID=270914 RepID=A0A7K1GMG4_9FLAO|nr:NERD domain-containing protein [Myroides pelagicus]MEC4114369.1 NERD domain-containing protein [Myroides pelagicus]MTH30092.1 DUF2075 domain-containing protein [Myroides pelagicus]
MPLQIYPEYSIDALEEMLIDGVKIPYGEFLVYKDLVESLSDSVHAWYVWYSLRLPFHDNSMVRRGKADAEIDFIIASKFGIVVLEVKGGNIAIDKGRFCYKDGKHIKWLNQNPFEQAKGYKYTLMNKVFPNFKHVLFCDAIAFPTTKIPIQNTIYDGNLVYSEYTKEEQFPTIEQFLLHIYSYSRTKLESVHPIVFSNLTEGELDTIVNTFSPDVNDTTMFESRDTLSWLKERNLETLYSLSENPRLMIEGAPGTGKTTMARAYAEMQTGRKGIYLCWNKLLCRYNSEVFKNLKLSIDCMTFVDFVTTNLPNVDEGDLVYLDAEEFAVYIKKTITFLSDSHHLPNYDYMIIDEAQDLFDRNLHLVMHKMCGDHNGMKQGNIMLLYDLDQSFSLFGRDVSEHAYFLKEYFTHFKLHKIRRSAQKSQIRKIAEHIQAEPEDWYNITIHQEEYDEIELESFSNREELKTAIVEVIKNINDPSSSLDAEDVIVLVQSKVWRRRNTVADLIVEIGMEELTVHNLTLSPTNLQYTTAVKFKGLERKNVILIVDKPNKLTPYEWYVGCTRAIDNLCIWQLDNYEEEAG